MITEINILAVAMRRPTQRQKSENMKKFIEEFLEKLKSGMKDFSYADQWNICSELESRIAEIGQEALQRDYDEYVSINGGEE